MCIRLKKIIYENYIIKNCKYDFLKNKSSELALSDFTNKTLKYFDGRKFALVTFFYLSKASDMVNRRIL